MAEKTVATSSGKPARSERETTRAQEHYILPPVDIYEGPDGLILLADLPGVEPNDMTIKLEDNILTIQAIPKHLINAGPIYSEFALVKFFRQFELSDQVDQGKITARLRHGVLVLELPKAEKAKPRQIDVHVEKEAA